MLIINMPLSAEVWGPHYWFVLYTMAVSYPKFPNDVTIKKYYDFLQNLPLFIPNEKMGNQFIKILDQFPPTPYLSSRLSFMKWVNFIHNRINTKIGKPNLDFYKSLEKYYAHYKPKELVLEEELKKRKKYLQIGISITLIALLVYIYNK